MDGDHIGTASVNELSEWLTTDIANSLVILLDIGSIYMFIL